MSIYVGNLSFTMTEADINTVFSEYGTVTRGNIPTDRETSRPRGFAFVDMEANSEEEAAISALDGVEMMERNLNVNKATPKKNRMANRGGGPAW
ncbi:RNA-binding protein [Acaryochloris marina]|uniref:RNA recognition motif domain-containing protein n=1 Tax=Acaryochloris marina TaxID=155978 RepID=UPI001BAF355D|nr:RNA-binding protein [Acaryochloris marina]QUY45712.1 RNA-binding protein [Acaryochloris marina S15]